MISIFTFLLSCSFQKYPSIFMETKLGIIQIELYPEKAPITSANFLRYIDEKRYQNAYFYRVVHMQNQPENNIKIEVIQGGLGSENNSEELPPIIHETTLKTGIKHKNGIVSMARLEPGTASSEIFICINDQPELDYGGLRNPDGQGFAAFGKVVSGMDVIRKIQQLPEKNQILEKHIDIINIYREK